MTGPPSNRESDVDEREVLIRGGSYAMGSQEFYLDEGPVRRVAVGDFWIDRHPVTNAQFCEFVDQTGYVTEAEQPPDPSMYPVHLSNCWYRERCCS